MTSHPSNLELQALSVLRYQGPSTVATVMEALPDGRTRAYTTVLSVMQSLEKKALIKRTRAGRAHVYDVAGPQAQVIQRAAQEFVRNAFGDRLGEAILHLISTGRLTPDEKTNIERELERHKPMAAKAKPTKKAAAKAPAKKAAKKAVKKASPAKKASAKKAPVKAAKKAAAKKAVKSAKKAAKAPAKKAVKKAAKKASPAKKKAPAKKAAAKKAVKKAAAKKAPAKRAAKKAAKKAASKKK